MSLARTRWSGAIAWALIALMATLIVAGCGGDAPDAGSSALSKRQYIQRADELQDQASDVFATLDGRVPATPTEAAPRIAALDDLVEGYQRLEPPADWRDEHEAIVAALEEMRQSLQVVSRASASNRRAIEYQVGRYQAAQVRYDDAIRSINASR